MLATSTDYVAGHTLAGNPNLKQLLGMTKSMPVAGQILAGKPRSSTQGSQALYSEKLIQDLQEARRDTDVKAVVLRVDSPGARPCLTTLYTTTSC